MADVKFNVGDLVEVTRDDGSIEQRRVKYEPWQLGDGTWVIGLKGITGGYALDRVRSLTVGWLEGTRRRVGTRMELDDD